MKLFFGEFRTDYSKYRFPYQVWLLKEEGDDIEKIYQNGFLPIRSMPNVYYLSRNIRIDLENFTLSSENRRILKKTERFESDIILASDFKYDAEVQKLCRDYAEKRFGKGIFPVSAIRSVFSKKIFNYIFIFKEISTQKTVGFAVCFISHDFLQYAHSFYSTDYLNDNLGARMILEAIIWAKKSEKKYAYLGTCYEKNALYKTEFKGCQFFNGFCWSANIEELKSLLGRSSEDFLLRDKEYLSKFHNKDLYGLLNKYGVRVSL